MDWALKVRSKETLILWTGHWRAVQFSCLFHAERTLDFLLVHFEDVSGEILDDSEWPAFCTNPTRSFRFMSGHSLYLFHSEAGVANVAEKGDAVRPHLVHVSVSAKTKIITVGTFFPHFCVCKTKIITVGTFVHISVSAKPTLFHSWNFLWTQWELWPVNTWDRACPSPFGRWFRRDKSNTGTSSSGLGLRRWLGNCPL